MIRSPKGKRLGSCGQQRLQHRNHTQPSRRNATSAGCRLCPSGSQRGPDPGTGGPERAPSWTESPFRDRVGGTERPKSQTAAPRTKRAGTGAPRTPQVQTRSHTEHRFRHSSPHRPRSLLLPASGHRATHSPCLASRVRSVLPVELHPPITQRTNQPSPQHSPQLLRSGNAEPGEGPEPRGSQTKAGRWRRPALAQPLIGQKYRPRPRS